MMSTDETNQEMLPEQEVELVQDSDEMEQSKKAKFVIQDDVFFKEKNSDSDLSQLQITEDEVVEKNVLEVFGSLKTEISNQDREQIEAVKNDEEFLKFFKENDCSVESVEANNPIFTEYLEPGVNHVFSDIEHDPIQFYDNEQVFENTTSEDLQQLEQNELTEDENEQEIQEQADHDLSTLENTDQLNINEDEEPEAEFLLEQEPSATQDKELIDEPSEAVDLAEEQIHIFTEPNNQEQIINMDNNNETQEPKLVETENIQTKEDISEQTTTAQDELSPSSQTDKTQDSSQIDKDELDLSINSLLNLDSDEKTNIFDENKLLKDEVAELAVKTISSMFSLLMSSIADARCSNQNKKLFSLNDKEGLDFWNCLNIEPSLIKNKNKDNTDNNTEAKTQAEVLTSDNLSMDLDGMSKQNVQELFTKFSFNSLKHDPQNWEDADYLKTFSDELEENTSFGSYKYAGLTWFFDNLFFKSPLMETFVDLHKTILSYKLLSLAYFVFISNCSNLLIYNEFRRRYRLPYSGGYSKEDFQDLINTFNNINSSSFDRLMRKNLRQVEKENDTVENNYYALLASPKKFLKSKKTDSEKDLSLLYNLDLKFNESMAKDLNLPDYELIFFNLQSGYSSALESIYLEKDEDAFGAIAKNINYFERRENSRKVTFIGCESFGSLKNIKKCLLANISFITPLKFSGSSRVKKLFPMKDLFNNYKSFQENHHNNFCSLSVNINTVIKDGDDKHNLSLYVSFVVEKTALQTYIDHLTDEVELECQALNLKGAIANNNECSLVNKYAILDNEGTSSKYVPNEEAIFYKAIGVVGKYFVSSLNIDAKDICKIYNYSSITGHIINTNTYYPLFLFFGRTGQEGKFFRRLLMSFVLSIYLKFYHYIDSKIERSACISDLFNIINKLDQICCYQVKGIINIYNINEQDKRLLESLEIEIPSNEFNICDRLLLERAQEVLCSRVPNPNKK